MIRIVKTGELKISPLAVAYRKGFLAWCNNTGEKNPYIDKRKGHGAVTYARAYLNAWWQAFEDAKYGRYGELERLGFTIEPSEGVYAWAIGMLQRGFKSSVSYDDDRWQLIITEPEGLGSVTVNHVAGEYDDKESAERAKTVLTMAAEIQPCPEREEVKP